MVAGFVAAVARHTFFHWIRNKSRVEFPLMDAEQRD